MVEHRTVLCPHCGESFVLDGIEIDGRFIRVPPFEARVWRALTAQSGAVVSYEEIARVMGGARPNAIHVAMYGLRRAIAGSSWTILVHRGEGYSACQKGAVDGEQEDRA